RAVHLGDEVDRGALGADLERRLVALALDRAGFAREAAREREHRAELRVGGLAHEAGSGGAAAGSRNRRRAFAVVARATTSTGSPRAAATAAPTSATCAGSLRCPRCGTGASSGQSVSTRMRSSGSAAATSRRSAAFLKVTIPENDTSRRASRARRAKSSEPV